MSARRREDEYAVTYIAKCGPFSDSLAYVRAGHLCSRTCLLSFPMVQAESNLKLKQTRCCSSRPTEGMFVSKLIVGSEATLLARCSERQAGSSDPKSCYASSRTPSTTQLAHQTKPPATEWNAAVPVRIRTWPPLKPLTCQQEAYRITSFPQARRQDRRAFCCSSEAVRIRPKVQETTRDSEHNGRWQEHLSCQLGTCVQL